MEITPRSSPALLWRDLIFARRRRATELPRGSRHAPEMLRRRFSVFIRHPEHHPRPSLAGSFCRAADRRNLPLVARTLKQHEAESVVKIAVGNDGRPRSDVGGSTEFDRCSVVLTCER